MSVLSQPREDCRKSIGERRKEEIDKSQTQGKISLPPRSGDAARRSRSELAPATEHRTG